ncbi:MAG: tetratricopeptide repeat protein [Gemmatimonadota bacterium]|nr:tetratricopeptide repeat protein [Gemmatimonadota bacterium]
MGRKRITKKQLKEDAFVSTAFEASHYIQENLTSIILSIVGVIALAGVVFLFINYRTQQANESALAMFKADGLYMNGQYALAAADFEKVAEDFSGSTVANKAVFFAGDSYYKAGEYEQALARFEQCREELSGDDPLMVNCLVGLAASYEGLENLEKAIELYREAIQAAEYDFQKIEISRTLSIALEAAGKNREAVETLDRIIQDYPDNSFSGEITELRAEFAAKTR